MNKYTVKFARGPKIGYSFYTELQKKKVVYFSEDTNEILVNGITYGINLSDSELSIISQVDITSTGAIIFTKTNGSTTTISLPTATQNLDGLLSKEDKTFLDSIPSTYATKEELNNSISRVYRFKGTLQYYTDLPMESQEAGDTYNILNGFDIDDQHYNAGVNVAWDGEHWDPLGGDNDGYSKLEIDDKFIAWTVDNDKKIIKLPEGSRLVATQGDGEFVDLIKLNIDGNDELVQIGDISKKIELHANGRPVVVLPEGNKKDIAYLSDIGKIDLSNYPDNAVIIYLPELNQSFIDENGEGDNLDGTPVSELHKPAVGEEIIAVVYSINTIKHIDWFTPSSVIPNAVHAAIQGLRGEYLDMFTWEEVETSKP